MRKFPVLGFFGGDASISVRLLIRSTTAVIIRAASGKAENVSDNAGSAKFKCAFFLPCLYSCDSGKIQCGADITRCRQVSYRWESRHHESGTLSTMKASLLFKNLRDSYHRLAHYCTRFIKPQIFDKAGYKNAGPRFTRPFFICVGLFAIVAGHFC